MAIKINYKVNTSDTNYTQMNFTNYELMLMCKFVTLQFDGIYEFSRATPAMVKYILVEQLKVTDFSKLDDKKMTIILQFQRFLINLDIVPILLKYNKKYSVCLSYKD
jgi:hypothetical protein